MSRLLALVMLCALAPAWAGPLGYGDPTQPPAHLAGPDEGGAPPIEVARPRWQLSAVIVAGQRRVAVINGRSVALGASIAGARLLAVEADGVTMEHENRRIRLKLPPAEGKTVMAKTPSGR